MGFFSWNCNGCGHPLLSQFATSKINKWMEKCVIVAPDSTTTIGMYDGYGRLGAWSWNDACAYEDEPCCWHYACWIVADKPTTYDPSECAKDQGYFFDDGEHDLYDPLLQALFKGKSHAK